MFYCILQCFVDNINFFDEFNRAGKTKWCHQLFFDYKLFSTVIRIRYNYVSVYAPLLQTINLYILLCLVYG